MSKEQPKNFLAQKKSLILLITILSFSITQVKSQDFWDTYVNTNEIFWEQDILTGLYLGDKSFAYYEMVISDVYFNGTQSLAIKVIPESYDSDPDIFISKNNSKPSSSYNSQWYCTKKGGDTCVIKSSEITMYDVLYIGVRCINPCNFTLSSNYFVTFPLTSGQRTQFRFDGYTSNLFSFYIPIDASDGFSRAVTFSVESEDSYNPIEIYFSYDNTISTVDDGKIYNLKTNGVAYYTTENDYGWCTQCTVYYFVNVIKDGRYYVTATTSSRSTIISANKNYEVFVNNRQQECYQYFVQAEGTGVLILGNQYQGDVDMYVASGNTPSSSTSSNVLLVSQKWYQRGQILSAADRSRANRKTGLYNICVYGNDDSSMILNVDEQTFAGRYDANDNTVYTYNLEKKGYLYFRYTNYLLTQKSNITITVQGYNVTTKQPPPRIYYKVCNSDSKTNCFFSDAEANGTAATVTQLTGTISGNYRIAQISHDPKVCQTPSSCYYLFSTYNPETTIVQKTSFVASLSLATTASALITKSYKNTIQQGTYFYYRILPGSSNGYSYLDELKITVFNSIGDSDIFVSTTTTMPSQTDFEYESRETSQFESITLKRTDTYPLNQTIYIGIYGSTFSIFYLSLTPTYSVNYETRLTKAQQITDGKPVYNYFINERNETFYSFKPWWAGYENRTIVFFADVIFNNIFFYMQVNDFPQFYLTDWQDQNDTIAVYPGNISYSRSNWYFIRARPDFALYDLISQRQYIFNFYVFSQVPNTRYQDLQVGESYLGYANNSNNYYRHQIIMPQNDYTITVVPIIGNPALLVKVDDQDYYPNTLDVNSWDLRSDKSGKTNETVALTTDTRIVLDFNCETFAYTQYGGSPYCTIYAGVECKTYCVYKIFINITNLNKTTRNVPIYLKNDTYQSGTTTYNVTRYYYIPVTKQTGDMVVFLNKTGPVNSNGDSVVVTKFISHAQNRTLENWTYPTVTSYEAFSWNNNSQLPEILEICPKMLQDKCGNSSCVLSIGVVGVSLNMTSNFRLLYFTSQNKLTASQAIQVNNTIINNYNYYWFTVNASVSNPKAYWEYTIATAVGNDSQDVDLFVTVLDGRFPISEDYDFRSDNMGADSITITSNDPIWAKNNYDLTVGVMVVVGVKVMKNNTNYTLLMLANQTNTQFQQMVLGTQYTRTLTAANHTHYFKWFNWGFRDFRVNIDVSAGQVIGYLNFYSEDSFQTNGYLAIPRNSSNAKYSIFLNTTQSSVLRVYKDDYSNANTLFCYYCTYFITITSNQSFSNSVATYRVSVNYIPDVGEEVSVMTINTNYTVTLPSTGTVTQRKFLLDSKDSFYILGAVTTGQVNIYVGLYPNSAQSKYAFSGSATSGKSVRISVSQTDQSFHLGAYYYITLQAVNGRTTVLLSVNQRRTLTQLMNGVQYKQLYWNNEERIKLYYFQIPFKNTYKVTINITSLTQNFYPTVYLYKNIMSSSPSNPNDQFTYPNPVSNNGTYGDNFTDVDNMTNVKFLNFCNIDFQFVYTFRDYGNTSYTYYTMALYYWSWGLTDRRKAEFKIAVTLENNTLSTSYPQTYEFTASSSNSESTFEQIQEWLYNKIEEAKDGFNNILSQNYDKK